MNREKFPAAVSLAAVLTAAFVFLIFCAVRGVSVHAAPAGGEDDPVPEELLLSLPYTVRELTEQFSDLGSVSVLRRDGSVRRDGTVESGDLLIIADETGEEIERFTVVLEGAASSSAPPEEPASSAPASAPSRPASSGGTQVFPVPSAAESAPPVEGSLVLKGDSDGFYRFSGPVTVEELAEEIRPQPHGLWVRVTSPSGTDRKSGSVCTGDTVDTLDAEGARQSRVIAVIPGDLTGSGSVTEESLVLAQDFLLHRGSLSRLESRAADMDENGAMDTSDLLLMCKSRSAGGD